MPEGECGYISKTLRTPVLQHYVTLSIVVYSIAREYPGTTALQIRYYEVKQYHTGL